MFKDFLEVSSRFQATYFFLSDIGDIEVDPLRDGMRRIGHL